MSALRGGRVRLAPIRWIEPVVFSSASFLFLFLPLVLLFYYGGGRWLRNSLLLVASLLFYAWGEPVYVLLMIASIAFNWLIGVAMAALRSRRVERALLAFGVTTNVMVLGYYKYAGLLLATVLELVPDSSVALADAKAPLLPIGISFFTFHAISYLVDIYRRDASALRSPFDMGLYIALFPQLVAGPIIRYHDIADQIRERSNTLPRFASGVERFVFGMAKKLLIANPLGAIADGVFALPGDELTMAAAWVGLACYTLQIYFDFSDYSDMAIGLGRMFGFEFLENFNYPYVARSVREFWRRWHLSLSTWFRDYLYIPLGGNRSGPWRSRLNLMIVFLLCGLWHGASWTFAAWGLWHGLFLVLERGRWGRFIARAPGPLQHVYALLIVMFGWVFFRSESFAQAGYYIAALAGFPDADGYSAVLILQFTPRLQLTLAVAALLSTPLMAGLVSDYQKRRYPVAAGNTANIGTGVIAAALPVWLVGWLRLPLIAALMIAIGANIAAGSYNPFIYFRF